MPFMAAWARVPIVHSTRMDLSVETRALGADAEEQAVRVTRMALRRRPIATQHAHLPIGAPTYLHQPTYLIMVVAATDDQHCYQVVAPLHSNHPPASAGHLGGRSAGNCLAVNDSRAARAPAHRRLRGRDGSRPDHVVVPM
jgi:hypothetical protein